MKIDPDSTDVFCWMGPDGRKKSINEAIAALRERFEVRQRLADELVHAAISGNHPAFEHKAKTPIDGADLLAIVIAAYKRGQSDVNPAKSMARLRHAENYALAAEAIKFWRENIDPNLSAAKAANILVQVVPLSHKKLAELVSAEKRKKAKK